MNKSKTLSRADILDAPGVELVKVHLTEMKGDIYVRPLTGEEASKIEDFKGFDVLVATILTSVCDEKGNQLFSDADRPRLKKLPAKVLIKIQKVANKLNAPSEDVVKN